MYCTVVSIVLQCGGRDVRDEYIRHFLLGEFVTGEGPCDCDVLFRHVWWVRGHVTVMFSFDMCGG